MVGASERQGVTVPYSSELGKHTHGLAVPQTSINRCKINVLTCIQKVPDRIKRQFLWIVSYVRPGLTAADLYVDYSALQSYGDGVGAIVWRRWVLKDVSINHQSGDKAVRLAKSAR